MAFVGGSTICGCPNRVCAVKPQRTAMDLTQRREVFFHQLLCVFAPLRENLVVVDARLRLRTLH